MSASGRDDATRRAMHHRHPARVSREGADDAGDAEILEHVVALDLVLRYPETWAAFQGRYLRALQASLAPLLHAGWRPDGPMDWETLHLAGRLREEGPMAMAAASEPGAGSPPPASGGRFAPLYVCVSASVRLRRRPEPRTPTPR